MPNPPQPPAGFPEDMRLFDIQAGINVECNNNGGVRSVDLEGQAWGFSKKRDPESSYLVRGYGEMDLFPGSGKMKFNIEGETGEIKTENGSYKPVCGEGDLMGEFSPSDWKLDLGTSSNKLDLKLGCSNGLSLDGYLKARPSGIKCNVGIQRSASTSFTLDIAVAKLTPSFSASLKYSYSMLINFSSPSIGGELSAAANAKAKIKVEPFTGGDPYDINLANISCGGNIQYKLSSSGLCSAGQLTGQITILGESVEAVIGVKVRNGLVSFPKEPGDCN
jgi:hypothetical protein